MIFFRLILNRFLETNPYVKLAAFARLKSEKKFFKLFFVKVNLKMYIFANLKMTINFPLLLTLFFLLYDTIVL